MPILYLLAPFVVAVYALDCKGCNELSARRLDFSPYSRMKKCCPEQTKVPLPLPVPQPGGESEGARDKPQDSIKETRPESRTESADRPGGKEAVSKPDLSLNDLSSLRDIKDLSKGEAGTSFDARKMSDISKLLADRNIARRLPDNPFRADSGKETADRSGRDYTWSTTHMLDSSANIGLSIPLGLRQHFKLRGVETKKDEQEDPQKPGSGKLDDFLMSFEDLDDSRLSKAQKEELELALKNLSDSWTDEEILSNSLHLARLLKELGYIEEVRKAVQLAASINPDHKLTNQILKELERVHPADLAYSPVIPRPQLDRSSLARRIIDLSKGRVVVVGDLLIDELLEGRPERISREAPVLILEHVDTELIPGGAANTANNITALGAACHAVGVCGDDEYAGKLASMLEEHGISHDLVVDPLRPTTVKTRILSKSHSLMQQLLRLDRISHQPISDSIARMLSAKVNKVVGDYQAVILSDYRAGAITDAVIESVRKVTKDSPTLLVVDAQGRFERFKDVDLITPNQPDTEAALGYKIDSIAALEKAGKEMLEKSGAASILITRGSQGMALFSRKEPMAVLPPFNKSEVFDVTGAGDTVVATMSLALVTGSTPVEAMALGNLAAGIVVKKSGTAVTSQKEMLDTLDKLSI